MLLSEKPFLSVQGEGRNCGKLAVFIRTAGCNLKCLWCDTKYSWNSGKNYDEKWLEYYLQKTKFIIVTGGEPLLHENLIKELREISKVKLEIETNGTIEPIPSAWYNNIQYSVSPKLSSSGEPQEKRIKPGILKDFLYFDSIFKFAIDTQSDLFEAKQLIRELKIPRERVWLMPVTGSVREIKKRSLEVLQMAKEEGFNFSPRLHMYLYGKKRGV